MKIQKKGENTSFLWQMQLSIQNSLTVRIQIKNICGAVVAMKLVFALYEKYGIPESEKEDYLEPAAIATVGDIMDLQGENRILVKEGLLRLPHTKNKGLKALIRAIGLENQKISSYDIGFRLVRALMPAEDWIQPCAPCPYYRNSSMRPCKLCKLLCLAPVNPIHHRAGFVHQLQFHCILSLSIYSGF